MPDISVSNSHMHSFTLQAFMDGFTARIAFISLNFSSLLVDTGSHLTNVVCGTQTRHAKEAWSVCTSNRKRVETRSAAACSGMVQPRCSEWECICTSQQAQPSYGGFWRKLCIVHISVEQMISQEGNIMTHTCCMADSTLNMYCTLEKLSM